MIRNLVLAGVLGLAGMTAGAGEPMSYEAVVAAAREGVVFVDNEHILMRQAENSEVLLLDVRTQQEFNMGRIPGARWMARGVIEFRLAETVRDAGAEIIIYCATGSRAALVRKSLEEQGYTNVSAHEGFDSWAGAGLNVENDYGSFTLRQKKPAG